MSRVIISNIPLAVKRLNEIYQFDSTQAISRYLYSHVIKCLAHEIVTGNLDDCDSDAIHDMIDDVMNNLPKTYALQGDAETRDNEKLKEDLIMALAYVLQTLTGEVIGSAICGNYLVESISEPGDDEIEKYEALLKGKYQVGYHAIGEHSYAISIRSEDDIDFDKSLQEIMRYRTDNSLDVIVTIDIEEE